MDTLYASGENDPFAFQIKPAVFSEKQLMQGMLTDDIELVSKAMAKFVNDDGDPKANFIFRIKNSELILADAPPPINTTSDLWNLIVQKGQPMTAVTSDRVLRMKNMLQRDRSEAISSGLIKPTKVTKPAPISTTTTTTTTTPITKTTTATTTNVPVVQPRWREFSLTNQPPGLIQLFDQTKQTMPKPTIPK